MAELSELFTRLKAVNRRLRKPLWTERPVIAVSLLPSFGTRWLVPRLGKFLGMHPEVDVRISASEHVVDFALEPFDLGVRYGRGRYPGLASEKLFDDAFVVVCSPTVLASRKVRRASDLVGETLLEDDHPDAWALWMAHHGVSCRYGVRLTGLDDSSMLVEAAIRGNGFALARSSLVVDELALGRLVLPFPRLPPMPTGLSYWLVAPRESFRRPAVAAFREWLRDEAKALRLAAP